MSDPQPNWNTHLFHCSSLPALMTKPKLAGEKISETAKGKLRDIWIEERYKRESFDSVGVYTKKGIMVESDALELVSKFTKRPLFKNTQTLTNKLLTGTPDVIRPSGRDIKSSWDLWTFTDVTEKKARKEYYWQMVGYMLLTNTLEYDLTYVLVDTPHEIAEGELYRMSFKLTEEQVEKARSNFYYQDIPEEERVKNYHFKLGQDEMDEISGQVTDMLIACREYLKSLDEERMQNAKANIEGRI